MSSKRKQSFAASADEDEDDGSGNDAELKMPTRRASSSVASEDDDFDIEAVDLVTDLTQSQHQRMISESSVNDYDSVSSPGGSSTASGPTYIRPAGFDHHAQEVLAPTTSVCSSRSNSVLSRHSFAGSSTSTSSSGNNATSSKAGPKKKKGLLSVDFKDGSGKKAVEGVIVASSTSSRSKSRKGELRSITFCFGFFAFFFFSPRPLKRKFIHG